MIMFIMSDKALDALMARQIQDRCECGYRGCHTRQHCRGCDNRACRRRYHRVGVVQWRVCWIEPGWHAGRSRSATADANYYGRPVTSSDIVVTRSVRSKAAHGLVREMGSL